VHRTYHKENIFVDEARCHKVEIFGPLLLLSLMLHVKMYSLTLLLWVCMFVHGMFGFGARQLNCTTIGLVTCCAVPSAAFDFPVPVATKFAVPTAVPFVHTVQLVTGENASPTFFSYLYNYGTNLCQSPTSHVLHLNQHLMFVGACHFKGSIGA
jgi:hypothetical protein